MNGENDTQTRDTRFKCVVGHTIDPLALNAETAMSRLDDGAEVRLCRLHGTAVAVTRTAPTESTMENPQP